MGFLESFEVLMKYQMILRLLWLLACIAYLEDVDVKLHLIAGGFCSQCGAVD